MSNWTPGPWEYLSEVGYAGDYPYTKAHRVKIGSETLTTYCHADGWSGEKVAEANARLMASAPDMYEALQRANCFITNGIKLGYIRMSDLECGDSAWETPDIIRRALAKAKGEGTEK